MAVSADHSSAFAWGSGAYGQLGLGHERNAPTPLQIASVGRLSVIAAACGSTHSLFLVSNARFASVLECGATPFAAPPASVAMLPVPALIDGDPLVDVVRVFAGAHRSAAVLENGRLVVWQRSVGTPPRLQPFGRSENVRECTAVALGNTVSYLGAAQ